MQAPWPTYSCVTVVSCRWCTTFTKTLCCDAISLCSFVLNLIKYCHSYFICLNIEIYWFLHSMLVTCLMNPLNSYDLKKLKTRIRIYPNVLLQTGCDVTGLWSRFARKSILPCHLYKIWIQRRRILEFVQFAHVYYTTVTHIIPWMLLTILSKCYLWFCHAVMLFYSCNYLNKASVPAIFYVRVWVKACL